MGEPFKDLSEKKKNVEDIFTVELLIIYCKCLRSFVSMFLRQVDAKIKLI